MLGDSCLGVLMASPLWGLAQGRGESAHRAFWKYTGVLSLIREALFSCLNHSSVTLLGPVPEKELGLGVVNIQSRSLSLGEATLFI